MANIMEILGRIKTAIYGRDVRQSIYDAILQCYKDATGNPESIAAHTGDTNNPHNVTAAQLGLETAAEDIANAKEDIVKLKTPEFDDFTKEGSTPPDARTAIAALTSKMSIFTAISKIKAALMGLVTLGEMRGLLVNNGLTTEAGKYFLDAAFGKTLADKDAELASLLAQLNSDSLYKNTVYSKSANDDDGIKGDMYANWNGFKDGAAALIYRNVAEAWIGLINKYDNSAGSVLLLNSNGTIKVYCHRGTLLYNVFIPS